MKDPLYCPPPRQPRVYSSRINVTGWVKEVGQPQNPWNPPPQKKKRRKLQVTQSPTNRFPLALGLWGQLPPVFSRPGAVCYAANTATARALAGESKPSLFQGTLFEEGQGETTS